MNTTRSIYYTKAFKIERFNLIFNQKKEDTNKNCFIIQKSLKLKEVYSNDIFTIKKKSVFFFFTVYKSIQYD